MLELPPAPEENYTLETPAYNILSAGPEVEKTASEYLLNDEWVEKVKATFMGRATTSTVTINDDVLKQANQLASAMISRLNCFVADRVHSSRQNHWTLSYTRDNIPPIAAAACIFGHIVDELDTYRWMICSW